ncbi:MAG: adenosylmethionine--8-amino-7-oxononanoate transaminase [Flavobacteriaceae bacterium]|nr:MAG: adenosylmethionine--8-amino-7-oxononanoate transaminase [Flavobacteriaceae bacterium]
MAKKSLSQRDLDCNWHPYTQHQTSQPPIVIQKGKDALLWDENGKKYIDAIGSWWANPHGHCNKQIAKAIAKQAQTLEHVLFGGFSHRWAIELSEKLLEVLPKNQSKIFYSDNGSTAVEVALKMCLQYYLNKGEKKATFIAFENAFHGDTFGAMAVSGIGLFSEAFKDYFIDVKRIPVPKEDNFKSVETQLESLLKEGSIAGFIFEPLVQGAIGMNFYKAKYLDKLLKICKKYKVLTIADEVMTGFSRTGKLFAIDYLKNKPDLVCLSKALTGGFLPLAATSCSQEIYQAFLSEKTEKAFFHGHTFMANPLGCAAAIESLKISQKQKTKQKIKGISKIYQDFEKKQNQHPKIKSMEHLGVIFRLEIQTEEAQSFYSSLRNTLYNYYISKGVILRPVGNIVYLLPSYSIKKSELKKTFEVILNSLDLV